jgi:glycosyltransferase involved in cell wall biosynthesis
MRKQDVRRVLMTGDTVGGVWTFNLDLAAALVPYGIEVILAVLGGEPTDDQRAAAAAIPNLHLLTSRYRLEWMDDPWRDVEASGAWLLDLEEKYRPDVVHLNSFGHGSLPWRPPVVLTAHSCVLSWWSVVRREELPPHWYRYRYEVGGAVKAVDVLTVPSRAMLHAIEENYGPNLPECRVIPNGRNSGLYHESAKEPLVLTAGRLWDEAKNVAAVAQAAAKLPWPAYVAGENRHPNGASVQLEGCHMLGRLSQAALAGWYSRAAIYALPARYEPFGLSILEAALSGCALVLGDIASLREVWADTALFVPPDDPDRLESALHHLITNTAERNALARRSTARARTFTTERMAREYVDAYSSMAWSRRLVCAS